jgi:hypothetical protein
MERRDWLIGLTAASVLLAPATPHRYRFTVEYFNFDARGALVHKERIAAEYTAGEPGEDVRWSHATLAAARSLGGAYSGEQTLAYMEGFSYSPARERLFSPEFFKGFPAAATEARNLVWDTFMLETLAQELGKAKAASPYHVPPWAAPSASGNTNVQLTWVGIVERNRQECALVHYEAFFNTVDRDVAGQRLVGRSDYWGDIWVRLATGEIEYATLDEEIAGELRGPSQPVPQPITVVRKGVFEKLL